MTILDSAHVTGLQKNTTHFLLQQNFINPTCTEPDRWWIIKSGLWDGNYTDLISGR